MPIMQDFMAMMAEDDDQPNMGVAEQVKALLNAKAAYEQPRDFEVGDFVTQKAAINLLRRPKDTAPGFVLKIVPQESAPAPVGQDDDHASDGNAGLIDNVLVAIWNPTAEQWQTYWIDERLLTRHAQACRLRDAHLELLATAG